MWILNKIKGSEKPEDNPEYTPPKTDANKNEVTSQKEQSHVKKEVPKKQSDDMFGGMKVKKKKRRDRKKTSASSTPTHTNIPSPSTSGVNTPSPKSDTNSPYNITQQFSSPSSLDFYGDSQSNSNGETKKWEQASPSVSTVSRRRRKKKDKTNPEKSKKSKQEEKISKEIIDEGNQSNEEETKEKVSMEETLSFSGMDFKKRDPSIVKQEETHNELDNILGEENTEPPKPIMKKKQRKERSKPKTSSKNDKILNSFETHSKKSEEEEEEDDEEETQPDDREEWMKFKKSMQSSFSKLYEQCLLLQSTKKQLFTKKSHVRDSINNFHEEIKTKEQLLDVASENEEYARAEELQQEIDHISEQIKNQENELNEIITQLDGLENDRKGLPGKITKTYRQYMDSIKAQESKQKTSLQDFEREKKIKVAYSTDRLKSEEERIASLKVHVEKNLASIENRKSILQERIDEQTVDIRNNMEIDEEEVKNLSLEINEMERRLKMKKTKRDEAQSRIADHKKSISKTRRKFNKELREIERQETDATANMKQFEEQQEVFNKEQHEIKNDLDSMEEEHKSRKESIQMISEFKIISSRSLRLLDIQTELLNELKSKRDQFNDTQQEQLDIIKLEETKLSKSKINIEKLQSKFDLNQSEVDRVTKQLSKIEAKIPQLEEAKAAARDNRNYREAGRLKKVIEEQQQKEEKLEEKKDSLLSQGNEIAMDLDELKEELSKIQVRVNDEYAEYRTLLLECLINESLNIENLLGQYSSTNTDPSLTQFNVAKQLLEIEYASISTEIKEIEGKLGMDEKEHQELIEKVKKDGYVEKNFDDLLEDEEEEAEEEQVVEEDEVQEKEDDEEEYDDEMEAIINAETDVANDNQDKNSCIQEYMDLSSDELETLINDKQTEIATLSDELGVAMEEEDYEKCAELDEEKLGLEKVLTALQARLESLKNIEQEDTNNDGTTETDDADTIDEEECSDVENEEDEEQKVELNNEEVNNEEVNNEEVNNEEVNNEEVNNEEVNKEDEKRESVGEEQKSEDENEENQSSFNFINDENSQDEEDIHESKEDKESSFDFMNNEEKAEEESQDSTQKASPEKSSFEFIEEDENDEQKGSSFDFMNSNEEEPSSSFDFINQDDEEVKEEEPVTESSSFDFIEDDTKVNPKEETESSSFDFIGNDTQDDDPKEETEPSSFDFIGNDSENQEEASSFDFIGNHSEDNGEPKSPEDALDEARNRSVELPDDDLGGWGD